MTLRRCVSMILLVSCALGGEWLPIQAEETAIPTEAPSAGVVRSGPTGFSIRHETTVRSSAMAAYQALTEDVARWWQPEHTFSGDAANLSIDAGPGGCFCESLPGGGVSHLTVVHADPGKLLRLTGGLGPLQGEAVSGSMSWTFGETEDGTRMTVTYNVWGEVDGGLAGWAEPVGRVIGAQFDGLAALLESKSAAVEPG